MTPWDETLDTIPVGDNFDLAEIQRNGELIALTLTGPETYYDYHGKHLGAQYLLAQRFADKLGVMLRMEVCSDTTEMLQRLKDGEADLICYPINKKGIGWMVVKPALLMTPYNSGSVSTIALMALLSAKSHTRIS